MTYLNVSLKLGNLSFNKMIRFFKAFILILIFFILLYGPALRCGIQFLGNLAVGNQMCKDDIWQLSFPNLLL